MTPKSTQAIYNHSRLALSATLLLTTLLTPFLTSQRAAQAGPAALAQKTLLMTHYMPWFQAKPHSASWGWHWTMNHYNPDHVRADGRRDAPSHYYPLIGLYDSHDPDALQAQALLMKMSRIDGVIFDWYGNDDFQDYGPVNHNVGGDDPNPAPRRIEVRGLL